MSYPCMYCKYASLGPSGTDQARLGRDGTDQARLIGCAEGPRAGSQLRGEALACPPVPGSSLFRVAFQANMPKHRTRTGKPYKIHIVTQTHTHTHTDTHTHTHIRTPARARANTHQQFAHTVTHTVRRQGSARCLHHLQPEGATASIPLKLSAVNLRFKAGEVCPVLGPPTRPRARTRLQHAACSSIMCQTHRTSCIFLTKPEETSPLLCSKRSLRSIIGCTRSESWCLEIGVFDPGSFGIRARNMPETKGQCPRVSRPALFCCQHVYHV